jgi:hypothetical protein
VDLNKYYKITKSQYRVLEEYLRSGDKREALKAGRYSTSEENIEKNFKAIMDIEKVQWAYQKMVREREKLKEARGEVPHAPPTSSSDAILDRLLDSLNDALAMAKMSKNPSAMANVVKMLAEIQGVYQPKKQAQKVLEITIHEEFDVNDQGGAIDYED